MLSRASQVTHDPVVVTPALEFIDRDLSFYCREGWWAGGIIPAYVRLLPAHRWGILLMREGDNKVMPHTGTQTHTH